MLPYCIREAIQEDIGIKAWVCDYINVIALGVITYPCLNFNGGLIENGFS